MAHIPFYQRDGLFLGHRPLFEVGQRHGNEESQRHVTCAELTSDRARQMCEEGQAVDRFVAGFCFICFSLKVAKHAFQVSTWKSCAQLATIAAVSALGGVLFLSSSISSLHEVNAKA